MKAEAAGTKCKVSKKEKRRGVEAEVASTKPEVTKSERKSL
jgi:hypothetical protein